MTENLPIKWDEELAKHANKIAATERPAVGRLAFRGGVMTYQGQSIPGNKLNVVILTHAKEHALYQNVIDQRPFDPNNPENPICFALAQEDGEMIPHPQALKKQAPSCADCQYNAWGSAPNGGRGKACKENRRLLLIPASAVVSRDPASGQMFAAPAGSVKKAESATASIPVTSVKNWANYTAQLAGEYQRPPWAMITEVSAVPDSRSVFKVNFAPVSHVAEAHLGDLMQRSQSSAAIIMTPYSQDANAAPAAATPGKPARTRKF